MKSLLVILLVTTITLSNASYIGYPSIHAVNPGVIIKGPSTKTIVAGPDGAVIKSVAEGAAIVTAPQSVLLPSTIIVSHAPVVVAHTPASGAVIAGPSGTIVTGTAAVVPPPLISKIVAAPAIRNGYVTKYIDGKPILGPLVTPGLGWYGTNSW